MKEQLFKLEDYLTSINAPIIPRLLKGLSGEAIEETLKPLAIRNSVVNDLYSWKNGLQTAYGVPIKQAEFLPNVIFQNLEETINEYKKGNFGWSRAFFPIFFSGTGDYYLVSKTAGDSKIYFSSVETFFTDKPFSIYNSLERFVSTAIRCFQDKAYIINDAGTYEVDFEKEQEIASFMNSDCELWNA